MKLTHVDGKFILQRSSEEKAPILSRLSRVEGQVRGLRQMVVDDRYAGDAMQQSSAIVAAMREVTLLMISQQVEAHAAALCPPDSIADRPSDSFEAMQDLIAMLRSTYRFQ